MQSRSSGGGRTPGCGEWLGDSEDQLRMKRTFRCVRFSLEDELWLTKGGQERDDEVSAGTVAKMHKDDVCPLLQIEVWVGAEVQDSGNWNDSCCLGFKVDLVNSSQQWAHFTSFFFLFSSRCVVTLLVLFPCSTGQISSSGLSVSTLGFLHSRVRSLFVSFDRPVSCHPHPAPTPIVLYVLVKAADVTEAVT